VSVPKVHCHHEENIQLGYIFTKTLEGNLYAWRQEEDARTCPKVRRNKEIEQHTKEGGGKWNIKQKHTKGGGEVTETPKGKGGGT